MSTIKEVLRLKYLGRLSNCKIGLLGFTSKSAVSNYITVFKKSELIIDEVLHHSFDSGAMREVIGYIDLLQLFISGE